MAETLQASSSVGPDTVYSGLTETASEHRSSPAGGRVEIDTSVPFESVREAATRFGGMGFWKPSQLKRSETAEHDIEETDIMKLEEQASKLEKDLVAEERETLELLKELEATKTTVEELKSKLLQNVASEDGYKNASPESSEEENYEHGHASTILLELNQAKLNLSRTTNDLADIRSSVELLNRKLEKERASLEKTRERLTQNSSTVFSLEKEIDEIKMKLNFAKEPEISGGSSDNPLEISKELQKLSSEAEKFKKMGEKARSVVIRAMNEIKQTKSKIKTAQIRLVAARKMKEAASAAEAVALAEIKALSNCKNPSQNPEVVTIAFEEYLLLNRKAKDAVELAKKREGEATVKVDESNVSNTEILKKVDEAAEEIKTSKKVLEETLERVEAANNAKLEVEEALRKCRSENAQRRRSSIHNATKFKNRCPPQHRRESCLVNANAVNLIKYGSSSIPDLKPTLSIGQILSRKLLLAHEAKMGIVAEKGTARQKVSLGQMLSKTNGNASHTSKKKTGKENGKQLSGKRKKFGFATKFSGLMNKHNMKRKKTDMDLR